MMINMTLLRDKTRLKKTIRGSIVTGSGNDTVMFVILKGDIGVFSGYKTSKLERVSVLGAGDLYIESSLIDDKEPVYTTVALSDAFILPVNKNSVTDFLRAEPDIAYEFIRELSHRLAPADSNDSAAAETTCTDCPQTAVPETLGSQAEKVIPVKTGKGPAGNLTSQPPHGFTLFPEEHGACRLPMENQDAALLLEKSHVCPICQNQFTGSCVKQSKLVVENVDSDMRTHYKKVEPLYYEILTCPSCYYSAFPDMFDKPERRKQDIRRDLSDIKSSVGEGYAELNDSDAVFARYYLALLSAQAGFINHQYVSAKLLYMMSRLYQDAGNKAMEEQTTRRALESFVNAYENTRLTPQQEMQACVLIGELYLKLGDLKNATAFFNRAKTNSDKSNALKRHAENRIYDIRTMAGVH